ncbi:MAG: AMP-binding protein, partial [bacterium]|nr:AMP-binding protein [bacterium]
DYPEDRIQYMVTNSLIRTLITNSALMEKFLFNGMLNSRLRSDDSSWRLNTILCLDSAVNAASFKQHEFDVYDNEGLTDEATTNPTPLATCRDRAYMLYTSGSTGAPKGAIIRHDGKINHIYAQIDALHLHRDTAFLQSAPTSSDISVWQFLAPVLLGGCTVIVDRDIVCDPGALFNEIHSRQVTSIELVPVVLQEFLRYIAQLPPEKRALPALERAMVTGEAVSVALVNHWWQMYPEIPLINAYGPTEAADDTSQWEMDAALPDTAHSVPIGKTLANLTNYILDRHFQLQPFGVPGEICVAGIGVGEGYWQNEEKTRESFVKNPYSTHTYDRVLYRTGDVGRWLPDGNLEFSGRIDQQVKIRGYRMELGEIEHQLLNHKGVREAAVLVRAMDKDNPLAKSLIAYVIGAAELTVAVLRDYLKTMLPEYMIPAYFVQLDEFPLTPNDKIDKKALPTPDEAGMRQGTSYEAPRNSGEELLASVLAEILGMQQVGINENYFALGGDSIKAIQFVSRLSQQGMKLEMRDIFQYPTVAELAFRMTAMKPKTIELDVKGTIPFTAIQQEFFREIHVDRHHHNQAVLLRGKPRLDENVLRTALTAMLHHHETLWLCFGTTIRQRYPESPPPLSFEVFDLQGSEDSEAAMGSHIDKLHASLNLELGELMKTALFRLDDSDRLFITIHHLVVDGVSWRILLEDLHSAYQSSIGPSTSPGRRNRQSTIQLPPKTASFKTWSEKIHEYSHSSEQEQEQAYWRQITSTPPLMLPSDLEGGTNLVQHSGMLSIDISEEETELLLREVHHAYNTQIDDILLTALAQAVQGWTGRQRIPVLLEGHGREPVVDVDVSRTVGWFTSMYPILLVLPDSDEPGRTIKEIKEILRKVPNKGIGYGILRYLAQDEAIVRNPWPEICFNYLGQFDDGAEGVYFATAAESSGQLISPAQEQLYALEIVGLVVENRFRLSVTYDGTRFQENTINRLLEMYHQALSVLTAHCRSKIEGEKTPGDFIYSDLSLDQFDAILEKFQ